MQRLKGIELKPIQLRGNDDARFAQYVRLLPNGCEEWVGSRNADGYGAFWADGRAQQAHRWKWQRDHGPLSPKLALDHFLYPEHGCIGPPCVAHVRPTTWRENTLRGDTPAARNLAKTHCPDEHSYSGDNLYLHPDGRRDCRKCRKRRRKAPQSA